MEIKQEVIKHEYLVRISNYFLEKVLSCNTKDKCPENIKMHLDEILELHTTIPYMIMRTYKANVCVALFMIIGTLLCLQYSNNPLEILKNNWLWITLFLAIFYTLCTKCIEITFSVCSFKRWKSSQLYLLSQLINEIPSKYLTIENNYLTLNFDEYLQSEEYKKHGFITFKKEKIDYIIRMMTAYSRVTNYFNMKYKLPLNYTHIRICEMDNDGTVCKITYEED